MEERFVEQTIDMNKVQTITDACALSVPGDSSDEAIIAERITLLLVASVIAAKSYDQTLEMILANTKNIFDSIAVFRHQNKESLN